ncbi:hypothetical protein DH2020_045626 [Rehmannia glutinosa]|uniref:Uncharacterized protein n=1 Tax=Rehmannia glutinosa TaxID=99300 RepID=A0ABR0UEC1_REHGL
MAVHERARSRTSSETFRGRFLEATSPDLDRPNRCGSGAKHTFLDGVDHPLVGPVVAGVNLGKQGRLGGDLYLMRAMGIDVNCVVALKDLQSYLSHLSIFMASDSRKFYILVDNRPWLKDLVSRPTHLWQLMVTKNLKNTFLIIVQSRLSPFANTRGRKGKKMIEELSELQASSSNSRKLRDFKKWVSLIDAVMLSRKRALLPVKKLRNSLIANSKLHRTLYGFIVFEVEWRDVRGINYLNELQTDTSLAIEAKVMRRWEFDSIAQAARSISTWFPGTLHEQFLLKEHLDATLVQDLYLHACWIIQNDIIDKLEIVAGEVFHDAQESFPKTNEADIDDIINDDKCAGDESPCSLSSGFSVYPVTMGSRTDRLTTPPPPDGPYKRRKVMTPIHCDLGISSGEADTETVEILSQTPDLTGLPSWVIFLQSYPVFCHLYRPWMCPLARALYVLISIVTVLIGFYDLYKNVPLLKATASSLFGPLFDWIETLEMISRIKYLGTMLFLHNFQKAIKWFLMVTRTIRSCLSFVIDPMSGPFAEFLEFFLPLWNVSIQLAEGFFSVTWMVVESCFTMVGDLLEILLLPLWYILLVVWNVATSVIYPIFWILWEILYAPIRLVLGFCSLVAYLCAFIYDMVGDLWLFASSIFNVTREVESTVSSYEVSMWRSLWNDLFSQVFRAVRSILNGFVAFFTACNRHRLSIYNHMKEINNRLPCAARRTGSGIHSQSGQTSEAQITPRDKAIDSFHFDMLYIV